MSCTSLPDALPQGPATTRDCRCARVPGKGGSARRGHLLSALGVVLLVPLPGIGLAQSSSSTYAIPRQSIDGGAGRATSASYVVHGTIGQPDAGPTMTSATYIVRGGFHRAAAGTALPDPLFSDGFEPP